MIADEIKNINIYEKIPHRVVEFINSINDSIAPGRYVIDGDCYANVDIYEPKEFENCKFEAHKKYIDIQILLEGKERLDCRSIDQLEILQEYDEERDVMFFKNSSQNFDSVVLEPGRFVFIYPWEAHKPQIFIGCKSVKKIVVKIAVNS